MNFIRIAAAFPVAVAVVIVGVSIAHTQFVLAALASIGAPASLAINLDTTMFDIVGLAPTLGPVIAIALAIGFMVAAVLKRVLLPLAPLAYPIAGAAAMATALVAMKLAYHTTPLAGARSMVGFLTMCAIGAIGGLVFSRLLPPDEKPS